MYRCFSPFSDLYNILDHLIIGVIQMLFYLLCLGGSTFFASHTKWQLGCRFLNGLFALIMGVWLCTLAVETCFSCKDCSVICFRWWVNFNLWCPISPACFGYFVSDPENWKLDYFKKTTRATETWCWWHLTRYISMERKISLILWFNKFF